MRKIILIFFISACFVSLRASRIDTLKMYEDSVLNLISKMLEVTEDSKRMMYSLQIENVLHEAIKINADLIYRFDSLSQRISILKPKHEQFVLYNWNVPLSNGKQYYHCIIQKRNAKNNGQKIIICKDLSDKINDVYFAELTEKSWFGALYFDIITKSVKGTEYYFLLGWDGNSLLSNKKIIDVLWFDDSENVHFGAPMFKAKKTVAQRVIFEYSADAVLSLNYDKQSIIQDGKKVKMIVFDHLIPKTPKLEGQYEFYVPDMSYDGFVFEKNAWIFYRNVDARNKEQPSMPIKNSSGGGLFPQGFSVKF